MIRKLGFGFARLPQLDEYWDNIDYVKTKNMVDFLMANNMRHFDTSYNYHGELSEEAIRTCVVERFPRSSFTLSDKLPLFMLENPIKYRRCFETQLNRCGVDYFDYYLLHAVGSDVLNKVDSGFAFIKKEKEKGRIKKIGFSFHDTADVLENILNHHPETEIVLLQLNYADWDDPVIQSRLCYETAKKHGVEIWVMEGLKGGFLANLPEKASERFKQVTNLSPAEIGYRFLANLDVSKILCGFDTLEHVIDNVRIFSNDMSLTKEENEAIADVRKILKKAGAIECTNCRYCYTACEENVLIPDIISIYNDALAFNVASAAQSYFNIKSKSGNCKECHHCEGICPQEIKIAEKLKIIDDTFTNL